MKNQKTIQKIAKAQKILRKAKLVLTVLAVMMTALTGTVFAADPLGTINSLSDFIFSAIKAIGLILLGFGVVQIGLSLKSHDASQRANGFLTFFGGVIIAFAKDIDIYRTADQYIYLIIVASRSGPTETIVIGHCISFSIKLM